MKPNEFVQAVRQSCSEAAVRGCVKSFENPPGRRPRKELVALSKWFNGLSAADRELVQGAMQEAADATLFGLLCVIDGVRVIEAQGEKSEFKLTAIRAGKETQIAPSEPDLHVLFNAAP